MLSTRCFEVQSRSKRKEGLGLFSQSPTACSACQKDATSHSRFSTHDPLSHRAKKKSSKHHNKSSRPCCLAHCWMSRPMLTPGHTQGKLPFPPLSVTASTIIQESLSPLPVPSCPMSCIAPAPPAGTTPRVGRLRWTRTSPFLIYARPPPSSWELVRWDSQL